MQVRLSYLLSIYAIVPFFFLVAMTDHLMGGGLARFLPRTPDQIFLYSLILGTPHIIASLFSFADMDYLAFYRKRLGVEVPLFLAAALILYSVSPVWAFIVLIGYTEYHGVVQQTGIGRFYFKAALPGFEPWKWVAITITTIAYGIAYKDSLFPARFASTIAAPAIFILLVPFIALSAFLFFRIQNRAGRTYLAAFVTGLLVGITLIFLGYPLLALCSARVIHDGPAFLAYITHDSNRRKESGKNILYRTLGTHIPVWLSAPALAIAIGFLLARSPYVATIALYTVAMLHYYVEGFIWKKGSIHRRYLRFT